MNPEAPKTCGCKCHKAKPVAVILFAICWLLAAVGVLVSWNALNIIGPILVIIAMIPKLGCCKCCKKM